MASNATIYKAALQIADMDRNYYQDHTLTLARHPSETDERMMVRLLAFIRHAHEALLFGRGMSAEDEPDLWLKDLTGNIDLWVDVGQPEEKDIRRACGRAKLVYVYSYGNRGAELWWAKSQANLARLDNLTVINLAPETSRALSLLAQRNMRLQCTLQDAQIWVADEQRTIQIDPVILKDVTTKRR
ncbi:MAG: YaeQ family protein [Pseudomonadota bacterium]